MASPDQEPQADAILFTALLELVGLSPKEVAMFTGEPLEKTTQWKEASRKMPHHIALSLVWLAKHIIEKAERAEASGVILLIRQPKARVENLEKAKKLLEMVMHACSWWASEFYDQAALYTKARGGAFDLRRND